MMFFTYFILASLTVPTAVSNHHVFSSNPHTFAKRQQYHPNPQLCGPGATCEESCGAGTQLCSDPETFFCYSPDKPETCCEPGSSTSWACNGGDYCLIDGWCCPSGVDPQACALSLSVSLPATFFGPTATSAVSNMTSAVTTPTWASTLLPDFTGAASPNTFTGANGLLYSVLIIVGNLF